MANTAQELQYIAEALEKLAAAATAERTPPPQLPDVTPEEMLSKAADLAVQAEVDAHSVQAVQAAAQIKATCALAWAQMAQVASRA